MTAIGLPPDAIRVVAPDVGGGFGAKIGVDREQIVVAWAAKHTGRPVRWVETRNENLMAMTQGRAQLHHIKIGGDRDGKIKAYRLDVIQDAGAFPRMSGFLPMLTNLMAPGVYDIPAVQADYKVVVTNTAPIAAYRGAGRPEAAATIERAVDWFAAAAGLDPAEVRKANFIQPDQFPFVTKAGAPYDTGEYEAALEKVLGAADYTSLRDEQRRRREAGDTRQMGLGLASYVEITAADGGAGETAKVEVHDDGTATVYTGSSAHGQGHHTAFAMILQSETGIPMDKIEVIHGDTDLVPDGVGTYASRSLQLGGSAVHKAAIEVKEEAARNAAALFEAAEADVVLDADTGTWHIAGDPDKSLTWAQVAEHADGGLIVANVRFTADRPTFPFGTHLSVVEVDTETGKVTLLRHITADDAGPVLNPVLMEGQRHGGIAQGAAQALCEEVLYDVDGNPLTSTLADYAAITAAELPSFELLTSETPTPVNPLGVKGIGEAGTIGSTPGGAQRGDRRRVAPRRPAHRHADDTGTCVDRHLRSTEGEREVKVELTVNGKEISADVEDRMLLVHFLRDVADLTATNIGCETTSCGACTVLLDGESVKSCTVLAAQADGRSVTTLEGLAADGHMHAVQEAFHQEHGLQCGFCTPGMVMAIVSLLKENPSPTEAEVRTGLEGNICRCTGYHNIVRAALAAAEAGK